MSVGLLKQDMSVDVCIPNMSVETSKLINPVPCRGHVLRYNIVKKTSNIKALPTRLPRLESPGRA